MVLFIFDGAVMYESTLAARACRAPQVYNIELLVIIVMYNYFNVYWHERSTYRIVQVVSTKNVLITYCVRVVLLIIFHVENIIFSSHKSSKSISVNVKKYIFLSNFAIT